MSKSIVQHQDGDLKMRQRIEDGYINLNDIAKSTGRRVDNWLRLEQTKDLLAEFEKQNIASSDLRKQLEKAIVTVTSGIKGQRGGGSTWAHPDVAIQFAQWCSPAFALWCSRIIRNYMVNGAGNPLWHIDRQKIKNSNEIMRDVIKAYVDRHESELSENRKKFIYNNVNDKVGVAIVGCCPSKFRRLKQANCFRDALDKNQLEQLEQLEKLATALIEKKDMCPLEAVENAKERLMINY